MNAIIDIFDKKVRTIMDNKYTNSNSNNNSNSNSNSNGNGTNSVNTRNVPIVK